MFKKMLLVNVLVLIPLISACAASTEEIREETVPVDEQETTQGLKDQAFDFNNHETFQPMKEKRITHIHGIGYPNSQSGLFVATHNGLKVYSKGKWFETKENNHDFMGFQPTATGFYSSGHPEKGSNLKNPLGLLFSQDFGQTLELLSFYGESDFHFMAASYESKQVYVVNTQSNSKISTGLFYSKDGKTWKQSKLVGLPAVNAHNLGVHPKLGHIVGISTPEGLYISHNNGDQFSLVSKAVPVYAFAIKNDSIVYVMGNNGNLSLVEQPLESDDVKKITLPKLADNEIVTNIAVYEKEISISTSKNSVWVTTTGGKEWTSIIESEMTVDHH